MKAYLLLFICALALPLCAADDANSRPLPRESQLEFAILADKEREISLEMEKIYQRLVAPIQQARSEAVKHACELVGISPVVDGKPACEVKDGQVRKIVAPAATGKEK